MAFLRFLCISLKAHGLWHLALGHRLSALGIEFWKCRIELLALFPHPAAPWKGSLVEPLGAKSHSKAPKRTPKPTQSAPKSPKRAQMSTTRRPAATNHQKSSPKHAPEQRRTVKKHVFPQVFVYFAESPWPMAFGPWPSTRL